MRPVDDHHLPAPAIRRWGGVVALVLLAACSSSPAGSAPTPAPTAATSTQPVAPATPPATSMPPAASIAEGTHAVIGSGWSIGMPATWAAYELAADGTVQPLDGAPPLGAERVQFVTAAALQGATLHAVGPAGTGGPAVSLTLTAAGPDTEAVGADVSEALRERVADEGISDLAVEPIVVSGRDSARATFRHVDGGGVEQQAITVYVPGADRSYLLAVSVPIEVATTAMAEVDQVVDSFRVG